MKPIHASALSKPNHLSKVGKWVERKTIAEILVCLCGNKYIKSRKEQIVCVRCIAKTMVRVG